MAEDEYLKLPEDDEEGLIRYHFFRGFEYEGVRLFLKENHDIQMSLRTLKRRIESFGLKRKRLDYNVNIVHLYRTVAILD